MAVIRDIAYVRSQASNLDAMESFLVDFGLCPVSRTETSLYMRSSGPEPVVHISEQAVEGRMDGFGLTAASLPDLETIASELGAELASNPEPGGGMVVRVTDPNGYRVDVVHRPPVAQLDQAPAAAYNMGLDRRLYGRRNETVRPTMSPSTVLRLGHVVLRVRDARETMAWYAKHFNMKLSDSVWAGDPDNWMMAMARCDLGEAYTDHHTLAFVAIPGAPLGIDHSAFEVKDFDDLMAGNQYLKSKDYRHAFGVGRHVAGSQIFDYWRDPAGLKIEHWTDGDHVNQAYKGSHVPIQEVSLSSWGPEPSQEFYA